jgi:hypothetical protein
MRSRVQSADSDPAIQKECGTIRIRNCMDARGVGNVTFLKYMFRISQDRQGRYVLVFSRKVPDPDHPLFSVAFKILKKSIVFFVIYLLYQTVGSFTSVFKFQNGGKHTTVIKTLKTRNTDMKYCQI